MMFLLWNFVFVLTCLQQFQVNFIVTAHQPPPYNPLQILAKWNLLEYSFPTPNDRERAISEGNLEPSAGTPIDVAPQYYDQDQLRIFVTIPRFVSGIPYSLAKLTNKQAPDSGAPLLEPYPNYEWNNKHGRDCDAITSAFRVVITECNQMWVLDSGIIEDVQHCAPQLLLFDLQTDKLLHRHRFRSDLYVPRGSLFITPVVVVRDPPPKGHCIDTMIYVADVDRHGIVVYNHKRDQAWRVEHKFMYPDPDYGTHKLADETFTLMDGIFGMTTDKINLYFHPLASISEYAIPLRLLNNESYWHEGNSEEAVKHLGERISECTSETIDSQGNVYCVTLHPIRLMSWNAKSTYTARNFRYIDIDDRLLEFVSGIKIVKDPHGRDELWMLSNRYQKIATGTQRANETNFRILQRSLADIQFNGGLNAGNPHNDLHNRLIFQ